MLQRLPAAGARVAFLASAYLLVGVTSAAATPLAGKRGPEPLRVAAVYPRPSVRISGAADFTVRFSAALAGRQRLLPRLVPALAGRWRQSGPRTLTFTAAGAFMPGEAVSLTVPRGIRGAGGRVLARAVHASYDVRQPSPVRLLQLLASLGYLPVHLVSPHNPRPGDRLGQMRALYSPPPGRLVLGRGWPAPLRELWASQRAVVVRGALMDFQSQRGLPMTGAVSAALWGELLSAVAHREFNRAGYTYAIASEASPETLTVYHNGAIVVRTLANTGIPVSPTALGTFPIYERLRSQVMRGLNPNGVPYADYVQWVSYFNGGDAVHYMPRASYGYPQSLGCVELPYAAAQRAWGYFTYGSLVTVT